MATAEAPTSSSAAQSISVTSPTQDYSRPLAIVTTLFFMWGFLTCLNDILVPHLKAIFDLNFAQVMLVQFAFFSAYFLFSVPWSKIVNRIGYQRTMVAGLLTMAVGALLFVPAASVVSYPLFLTALSWPILKERVSRERWIAVSVGFVGVLVMARPSGAENALAYVYTERNHPAFAVDCPSDRIRKGIAGSNWKAEKNVTKA